MGIFRERKKQPTLPNDIIGMMERFGQFEFNPQTSAYDGEDIGRLMAELYPFASANPDGFLVALAEAVLPVGGWAVYGASRTIWELLSPSNSASIRQNSSYKAIMNAALEFLRTKGRSFMMLRPYEQDHWVASGGIRDTWMPRPPTSSQVATNPANIPDSPEAWEKAGLAHIQSGHDSEALVAFNHATQLNPTQARYYVGKGFSLNNLGRHQEALTTLNQAIHLDPNNGLAYACIRDALRAMGRLREAEAAAQRARDLGG